MMRAYIDDAETIEKLCGVIAEQADIIRAQHRVIAMLGADDPTEEQARETKKKCNELAGDIF